jgi:hypothetical protein
MFPIYDIDLDGNLEIITCSYSEFWVWDLERWQEDAVIGEQGVLEFSEPPKMADVIGDDQLEIIATSSAPVHRVWIYDNNYDLLETIEGTAIASTLVADVDNDGQNELILISRAEGNLRVYETSAYADSPPVRTTSNFYSERNLAAGVYVPPPGAPQPILKEEYPANESFYVELNPTLSIHAIDFRYDLMNVTISTNASGEWENVSYFNNSNNGFFTYTPDNMDQKNTTYYWRVTAVDPYVDKLTTIETYHFTTAYDAPYVSNQYPANDSTTIPSSISELSFSLTDLNGDTMSYSVETSPDIGSDIGSGIGNGSYSVSVTGLSNFTLYTWFVNVTDGTHWTREVYTFRTEPETLIVDAKFNDNTTSEELRDNSTGQDWYVSYGDENLVTLDKSVVGPNTGHKVSFNGTNGGDVYLSQEFTEVQKKQFSVQWDIYIDEVINISDDPDRTGWMFIGDDSDGINGPCSSDDERFLALSFYKEDGGTSGNMNLVAINRYDSWESNTTIAYNLALEKWYTMRVDIDLDIDRYKIYIDGELRQIFKSRTKKDALTHICFAQLDNGSGSF